MRRCEVILPSLVADCNRGIKQRPALDRPCVSLRSSATVGLYRFTPLYRWGAEERRDTQSRH